MTESWSDVSFKETESGTWQGLLDCDRRILNCDPFFFLNKSFCWRKQQQQKQRNRVQEPVVEVNPVFCLLKNISMNSGYSLLLYFPSLPVSFYPILGTLVSAFKVSKLYIPFLYQISPLHMLSFLFVSSSFSFYLSFSCYFLISFCFLLLHSHMPLPQCA